LGYFEKNTAFFALSEYSFRLTKLRFLHRKTLYFSKLSYVATAPLYA
jgi:hypothetical protein